MTQQSTDPRLFRTLDPSPGVEGSGDSARRELDAEAMRRRIGARLFGEVHDDVLIGRFRVLETLGEGGMGVVYAAEDAQLGRQVAIKAIRGERLRVHPGERARLLREARSLARLSHPNVVQVYEVGEDSAGVFIVMELVRGTTLRRWLDEEHPTLTAVLARFIEAGRGLDAAHQVGIVHRDFKPSNALVGADGRVRIVDFGLARGDAPPGDPTPAPGDAGDHSAESIVATAPQAGTPAYMSPEQALGAPCDARSDQFSFCVALYEAVHGKRPFTPAELTARLRHPESWAGPAMPEGGAAPRWLRRVLARGLALRPEDRYPSMAALLAALEAPPRRRRRIALALVGAATLATGVVAGGALVGARRPEACPASTDRLAGAWDEARRVAVEAAFAATRVGFAASAWTRAEAALDDYARRWTHAQSEACAATRIRGERSDRSLDESTRCLDRARRSLASLTGALAEADPALVAEAEALVDSLADPASCLDLAALDPTPDPLAGSPEALELEDLLDRARIFQRTHQGREAAATLADVLARSQQLGDASREAEALLLLGKTRARLLREPRRAVDALHQAYDCAIRAGRHELVWEIWSELAWVTGPELDDHPAGRVWLEHARSARPDPQDLATAHTLRTLESQLLAAEGRAAEAVRLRREALDDVRTRLPPERVEVIDARDALAVALAEAGHHEDAKNHHQALWTEVRARLGDDHPWSARLELFLGLDLFDLERVVEARHHLERARAALTATYGPTNPSVATADVFLAQLDLADGALDPAIERARAALDNYTRHFPRTHRDRVTALALLSELFRAADRPAEQLEISLELLAIHDTPDAHVDGDLPGVLTNIGESLCALDRCDEALPYFSRLMALYMSAPPDAPELEAMAYFGVGRVHVARGKPALAVPLFERALEILQAHPDGRPGVRENLAAIARALADALAELHQDAPRVRELRRLAAEIDPPAPAAG
jgi:tetratricopeptide (TPR) repeat protein/predicted Ser/Thr protein kinase